MYVQFGAVAAVFRTKKNVTNLARELGYLCIDDDEVAI